MKHIIKAAKTGAKYLRNEGYASVAEAVEVLAREVEHTEQKHSEISKLKKGDKVVMHTCMEADNPKYEGKIWTCKTDAFRPRGHNYCSIFLEGFSGSFSAEFLQKVDTMPVNAELTKEREANAALLSGLRWIRNETLKRFHPTGTDRRIDSFTESLLSKYDKTLEGNEPNEGNGTKD